LLSRKYMALLVFSDRCHHCHDILKYIQGQPALQSIIRFWNVTTQGIPHKKITRVPTLVTDEGKMFIGSEVRNWLESMTPFEFESFDSTDFTYNIDGSDTNDFHFQIEKYGTQLQPHITPELEEKINSNPSQAYQKRSSLK
jgi:hypothetical protein